jgi:hypothetical protein
MPVLTLTLTQNPSFVLLALALLRNSEIAWDTDSGDQREVKYGNSKGSEKVRAELEKGIPGKEASYCLSTRKGPR